MITLPLMEAIMRANEYRILVNAVEEGIRSGVTKAYKHADDSQPPDDYQIDIIIDYTMNSICEWFIFNGDYKEDE